MNEASPSPLSFSKSLALFAVPWLVFVAAIYIVLPALGHAGVPLFLVFLISLGIPLGLLAAAALVAYQREGGSWTWGAFSCRFRLMPMQRSTWLWTLGLTALMILAPGLLSFSADMIQQRAPLPDILARLFAVSPEAFMGVPLAGAWWLVPGYLAYMVINVAGEELWWRGYILPRQVLSLGKWTWLVHGVLWNLFHSFFYWELVFLLPGCLALSYLAQKSKNTWPGIIAHLASSIPTLILLTVGVLQK